MFSETEHDFGVVAHRTPAEYRFEFVNKYKETVHVHSVSASCKCVSPSVTVDTLKTWEKSELVCKFETDKNFFGDRNATITVRFDKPFWAEVQIQIKGTIRGDLEFDPPKLEFGQIEQGQPATKTVRVIHHARDVQWRIVDVASTYRSVSVRKSKPMIMQDSVVYDLEVTVKDDAPAEAVSNELIVCTGHEGFNPVEDRIPLAFTANITGQLEISPRIVRFGPVKPEETANAKVILKGKKPFTIKDVLCGDDNFSVTAQEPANGRLHVLDVSYVAKQAEAGEIKNSIKILTDLDHQSEIEVPVVVTIADK